MKKNRELRKRNSFAANTQSGKYAKAKDFKKAWGQLLGYFKVYGIQTIVAIIFSFVGTIMLLNGPRRLGEISDLILAGIKGEMDFAAIEKICYTLVALYLIGAGLLYLQEFFMVTVIQGVSKKLRKDISIKINKLPLRYFDSTTLGDIMSRATNDVDLISQSLNQSIGSLAGAIAMFFGSLYMMFRTNPILTLTAIASTIVGFSLMIIIMSKSQKYFTRQQQSLGEMNGYVEEMYGAHTIIKVYNAEGEIKEEFNEINDDLYDSAWKSQFISGIMNPIMGFIGNFGYVAVSVVGAIMVAKGMMNFGVIVSFMIYIRQFTNPLTTIAQAATSLQSTAAASERVFEFLGEEELEDESYKTKSINPKEVNGNVEFEHVRFGYDEDKIIIKDFSAEAKAGQKVAIVGPTGAGKTTLVNLLMRFYELNSGKISVDGVDIKEITRENVHDLFCMVLQDTWIFEGTIKENIKYSKTNVSDEEVVKACKAVGLDHYIRTLPKGYNTVLDNKTNLSQGQKQLMTIARAMVENAPMLILDEATSSVDTRTEVIIQKAMDKLMEGRTSFVIAHRLSTIKNSDMIFVMDNGDIIESGNHEELMAKNGFYTNLYNSQFEQAG
ncbi:ABC transporter ATP-binding protein [Miniphocaeibacter halophilus]|uniref:ABC transporter ATP-binding protein n=1 Tax=Miniphocaeibacter halophilus TaxID=2931922 RepID=A0AC61MQ69_9FIRM|nr:ABC transporter ATP-binding protein [Miniphocaeibacter halophilus]QQK07094.1 ABC transporter ATP-binding protein [Miniphocaeibacter halophilus]